MDKQTNEHFEDLARGCLLGALCGDAIGAFLEFRKDVSEQEADEALKLPGGGPFRLGRGQITDDGELTLCLGQGLVDGRGVLDLNTIALNYKKWIQSSPFDIGITTRNALAEAAKAKDNHAKGARKGSQKSIDSQSNGALMRITPLAIWCSELRKEHLIKSVTEETKLTHPNQIAINASVAYAYTIQHLLKNKGDYEGAFKKCKEIAAEFENKEIVGWIESVEKGNLPQANQQIGWLKIAFSYALYYLRKNMSYSDAMKHMLLQGGDTDTNCCIVGGMLGALYGYKALPEENMKQIMLFDPAKNKNSPHRPDFLVPGKTVDNIIEGLIRTRPKFVYIVGEETEAEVKSHSSKGKFW